MAGIPLVQIDSVSKLFDTASGDRVHALDHVSLDVAPGEFLSVIGPSGCGKSTLLRIVAGLIKPSSGKVMIGNREVAGAISGVGFVFQKPVLFDWCKVLDNVLAPARLADLNPKTYLERAHELIRLVELQGFEDKYPLELSGGMQQRAAIARALLLDPDLLIMDEPFGALDAITRDQLNLELLRIWRKSRKTAIFVTHNISEAILLGDRVAVLSQRPGSIKSVIPIDLPRPRGVECKSQRLFGQLEVELYNLISQN